MGFSLQIMGILAAPPPPPKATPPSNKGLIAGLIKGNQWLINPDHKALFLRGGGVARISMNKTPHGPTTGLKSLFEILGRPESSMTA